MDILWSPWRYDYIRSNEENKGTPEAECVFCGVLENPAGDDEKFIVHRAGFNFVILNIFPYITGHLLVVPYSHLANLAEAPKEVTDELMDLTKKCQELLGEVYRPDGFNLGMNIGKAAGAGVAAHFHMHVMPRWAGDANFMTAIGETRTIPEMLTTTYEKLKGKF
jgi:ATP adenylyltransferase